MFLAVFFIFPLLNEIKINSKDLISAKNRVAFLSAQTKETENFKNNYEAHRPNLDKIEKMFVDSDNPVDFIKFLEKTATDLSITSQISLPSSKNSMGTGPESIIFQLSSKGSFSEMLNFTQKIETGPYLIEIENLTIQNSQEKDTQEKDTSEDYLSRKVDATFTIKAFIKPR